MEGILRKIDERIKNLIDVTSNEATIRIEELIKVKQIIVDKELRNARQENSKKS